MRKSSRTRSGPLLMKLLMQVHLNPMFRQRLRAMAFFILAAALISPLAGCVDLTGLPADPLAAHGALRAAASDRYPGHVYCMRGFLGIFSTGMDTFSQTLNRRHIISAAALADEARMQFEHHLLSAEKQRLLHGPLILVGHSYGADDQIRVARYLGHHGYKVMLLVLLDPVTPPRIPSNVRQCFVIYKSHPLTDWLPFFRGVPAKAANPRMTHVTNVNVRDMPVPFHQAGINHVNISADHGVRTLMLNVVLRALRDWKLRHNFPVKATTLRNNPRFP